MPHASGLMSQVSGLRAQGHVSSSDRPVSKPGLDPARHPVPDSRFRFPIPDSRLPIPTPDPEHMPPFRTIDISDPRFEAEGLRHVTVKSPSLRGRGDVTVWSPAGVDAGGTRGPPAWCLRQPLVLGPQGWRTSNGEPVDWRGPRSRRSRWPCRATACAAMAPPTCGMATAPTTSAGSSTRYRSLLVRRSPDLDASAPLCLAGLSMGGFGALRLGARHCHTRAGYLGSLVDDTLRADGTVRRGGSGRVRDVRRRGVRTRRDHRRRHGSCRRCGSTAASTTNCSSSTASCIARYSCAVSTTSYEEFPGGHTWPYWEAHLDDTLRFFGKALRP